MRKKISDNIKNNILLYKLALFLGLTGYGGMAVIARIKHEYVDKHGIIDEKKFLHSLSLAQVLPGSTVISLVSYFSYLKAGLIGALISTALYIFPSFVLTMMLSAVYFNFGSLPAIARAVGGLNILLTSLLTSAFFGIGRSVLFRNGRISTRAVLITAAAAALYFFTSLSVIYIIIASGFLGTILYFFTGDLKDDLSESEIKFGKLFLRKKAWGMLLAFIIIFSVSVFYISEPLWVLFSSFLKIGSLAFGGGIAAIPLIKNVVVHEQQWFTLRQFWDGMSITQITPGPIFISSAFFGYHVAGIGGAFVSTAAICIPSFLLIIVFGKIHDRIKDLAIVRGIIRGFLAGFMGILAVMILRQLYGLVSDWRQMFLFAAMLLILLKNRNGLVIAIVIALSYSFVI